MARYSVYSLDRNKQIVKLTLLDCVSDQEASRQAAALVDDNAIELWRDERRLRRFDAHAPKKRGKPSRSVPRPSIETQLEDALAFHRAGQFAQAEKGYAAVLRADKEHVRAMTLLGTLRAQQGHLKLAVRLLNHSLELDERQPFALNSLGNALNALERHDEALSAFDKAIALDPDQAATYSNGGNALRGLKRYREALAAYRKAIAIDPAYAEAYSNRGDLLQQLKRYDDAVASYDKALALRPDSVRDWIGRGAALQESDRSEQALVCYDRVIALNGDVADAWNNRGNALAKLQRYDEALKSYHRAIEVKPDHAAAHYNQGNALRALRRSAEAAASYDRAIAIQPSYAEAHLNRGIALRGLKRLDEALESYNAAIALDPTNADAYFKKSALLRDLKRFDAALESIDRAIALDPELPYALGERLIVKQRMCDWSGLEDARAAVIDAIERGSRACVPFAVLAMECTPAIQRRCAESYVRDKYPSRTMYASPAIGRIGASGRKIRVAYVSANYHSHPVARHVVGLLETHDETRFETIGVSLTADDGTDFRSRVRDAFDHFVEVKDKSDEETAALLRDMDVDIAIDLMAFTTGCRPGIFARRAAPIQVNYLGYAGTTGTDYIDYMIADKTVIPELEQPCYSEKIVYLPDTYIPNDFRRIVADTPDRKTLGLPEHGFVFCSINNSYKFTPDMFDIWMRLLSATENSVLWLPRSNAAAVSRLQAEAHARGMSPSRLVFAAYVPKSEDHLARLRQADLFLDTLPYNAHSTACEALWAGVPVLTCMGETFAGRVAASLLNAVGLPDMVTHSLDEYEARALAFAREPSALAEIKARLARNRQTQPLFDTVRFTRHLEAAYRRMVDRHRAGEPPIGFAVARSTTDFENTD